MTPTLKKGFSKNYYFINPFSIKKSHNDNDIKYNVILSFASNPTIASNIKKIYQKSQNDNDLIPLYFLYDFFQSDPTIMIKQIYQTSQMSEW